MVKPLKPIGSYTTSTYQSFDGSNFTLTGLEEKFKGEKGYVSTFLGGATNFKNDAMLVLDLKAEEITIKPEYLTRTYVSEQKSGKSPNQFS